ncbi:hypothetical protein D9M72_560080 [compost metagenome]
MVNVPVLATIITSVLFSCLISNTISPPSFNFDIPCFTAFSTSICMIMGGISNFSNPVSTFEVNFRRSSSCILEISMKFSTISISSSNAIVLMSFLVRE